MTAIIKKELRSYFYSVTGALFIAANLLFSGIYFTGYNLTAGLPSTAMTISSSLVIFLFITPLLTMGIIASEVRQKTDRLLYTSPTPIFLIVLGKYLSMLLVFLVPACVNGVVYPLIMSMFGKVSYGECLTAFSAYILFGATAIAIGLFVSSFTENQIISAVLTFAALFITFMMSAVTGIISSEGNLLTRVLGWFDTGKRLDNLMGGILDLRAVVYYLCIIFLMLFLTYENIQRKRYTVSVKNLRLSAYSVSAVIVVTAAAVLLNFIVLSLPDEVTQFDLTENGLYTISEESLDFIKGVDKELEIYCLSDEDSTDEIIKKTLSAYASNSSFISLKYVDLSKNPQFLSSLTDEEGARGDILVKCGDNVRLIHQSDMIQTQMDYESFSTNVTGIDAEGQLASAISSVMSEERTMLKYVTGHGELEIPELTLLNRALKKKNLEMESLNLLSVEKIEDTDILFICAPTSDYSKEEAQKVISYLEDGGKAFIATQYSQKEGKLENFNSVFEGFGVKLSDGIVVEGSAGGFYGNNPMYLLPEVSSSPMTDTLYRQRRYAFIPYAQAIIKDEELPEGVELRDALVTSDKAFIADDISGDKPLSKPEGAESGSFVTAAYITKGEMKLALLSGAMALTDDAASVVGDSNISMVVDAAGDMAPGTESSIYIPAKDLQTGYITVSRGFVILYSLLFAILLPVLILVFGIIIWAKRRRR